MVALLTAGAILSFAFVRYHSPAQLHLSRPVPYAHHAYISFLKTTLTTRTRPVYILGCALGVAALVYAAQLSTTTICHPALMFDTLLLPEDCSDVFTDA